MTASVLEQPNVATADRVEVFRDRFRRAVEAQAPSAAARRWRLSVFERGLNLADEIEARAGSLEGKRLLDVGSAHGGDVAALCARGAICTATDKFDYGYAALHSYLQAGDRLDHRLFDCTQLWPFQDHSFDVVVCMAVIEHIDDLDAFFAELLRVLKPDGLAVVSTGAAFKSIGRDPLFGLPLTSLLPMPWRVFVAQRIFRRHYEFDLSRHTFYSAAKLTRCVTRQHRQASPAKYAASPIMARVARWPLAGLWQRLLRHFAYDFVVIR